MNKMQINLNPNFSEEIDLIFNGEDFDQSVLNRPLRQIALNTGWLKNKIAEVLSAKEDKFIKKTGFNRDFGNIAGTVVEGNDPRLSDARTPLPHTHNLLDLKLSSPGAGYIYFDGEKLIFKATTTSSVTWENILNLPIVFKSSVELVEGLNTELVKKADKSHSHVINEITGLEDQINYLLNNRTVPEHTHTMFQIIGLNEELDSKADISHIHTVDQIVGVKELIQENTKSNTIKREKLIGPGPHQLSYTGYLFKVTLNGIDLEDWTITQGNILTVEGLEEQDILIAYSQESEITARIVKTATTGDNVFTLPEGVQVWQVTLNGIDLDDFSQTGNNLEITNLSEGDKVIIYGSRL
jgi:hypothetical protein